MNGTTPTPATSVLTLAKHIVCNFTSTVAECPIAGEFNITASSGNGSSISFNCSKSGTPLTINPPFHVTYQITESSPTQGFIVTTIPAGTNPIRIAFNPNNGDLYVTNFVGNSVSVIKGETNTVVATIPVGSTNCRCFQL